MTTVSGQAIRVYAKDLDCENLVSFAANDANLRWYLGWQADAMVNSLIARSDLDTEMTVVRNEFERGENNAQNILEERVVATAYLWHNYGKSVIGSRAGISARLPNAL